MFTPDPRIAYLAGFFDGEGCIHMHSYTVKGKWGPYYQLLLTVSQLERKAEPLYMFQKTFGGGVVHRESKHRPQMVWRLEGKKCLEVLHELFPYLTVKRSQAAVALCYLYWWEEQLAGGRIATRSEKSMSTLKAVNLLLRQLKHQPQGMAQAKPEVLAEEGQSNGYETVH